LPTSDGEITVEIFREIVKVFSRQSSDVRGFLKVWERLASSRWPAGSFRTKRPAWRFS